MIGEIYIFKGVQPKTYPLHYKKGEVCTVIGTNSSNITFYSEHRGIIQTILREDLNRCFEEFTIDSDEV